jgi:hypothetical protein
VKGSGSYRTVEGIGGLEYSVVSMVFVGALKVEAEQVK